MLLIVLIVLILYSRIFKYYKLIDDPVPRDGYLRELPRKVHYSYYDEKRPWSWSLMSIVIFMGTCLGVYLCFGFKTALLYAVMPLNVCGVAWGRTGSYYMATSLLVITSYYFLKTFHYLSPIFYFTSLHSTVEAIPYIWVVLLEWGQNRPEIALQATISHLLALGLFIFGRRFRDGIRLRQQSHRDKGLSDSKFNIKNLFLVPKIIGYYICLCTGFTSLGLFHDFGRGEVEKGTLRGLSREFWFYLILVLISFCWALEFRL